MSFSDFIIYVDESGDHSLTSVDRNYPIFVLSFCIFRKREYVNIAVPKFQEFKFRWFGHDLIIFHETDIVRRRGHFGFLQYDGKRERFHQELNEIMAEIPMTVISAVIHKEPLLRRYARPHNPYELALLFCLEQSYEFLACARATDGVTHVICEARSPRNPPAIGKEDGELKGEFYRIIDGGHPLQPRDRSRAMPCFEIAFASKQTNSTGLQLADLIARPIGLNTLRPAHGNRAFRIIADKIWKGVENQPLYGLKVFP